MTLVALFILLFSDLTSHSYREETVVNSPSKIEIVELTFEKVNMV
jgi:hypothetical protein